MKASGVQRAGLFLLDKPSGPTSHDIVQLLRKLTGIRRVGHGGTLDPQANGLLPIFIGPATRLIEYLQELDKLYDCVIRLGIRTDSDDAEGRVVAEQPVPAISLAELDTVLNHFRGELTQVPPTYSAVKVHGAAAYRLARQGVVTHLAPRSVSVYALDILDWTPPDLHVRIRCGSGTYVRAIARDLGETLKCGGHLAALRRMAIGPVLVEEAVTAAALESAFAASRGWDLAEPLDRFLRDWPHVALPAAQVQRVRTGNLIRLGGLPPGTTRVFATDETERPLAILVPEPDRPGVWHPHKVLPPATLPQSDESGAARRAASAGNSKSIATTSSCARKE